MDARGHPRGVQAGSGPGDQPRASPHPPAGSGITRSNSTQSYMTQYPAIRPRDPSMVLNNTPIFHNLAQGHRKENPVSTYNAFAGPNQFNKLKSSLPSISQASDTSKEATKNSIQNTPESFFSSPLAPPKSMYCEHNKLASSKDLKRIKNDALTDTFPRQGNMLHTKPQRLEDKDGFVIPTILPKPPQVKPNFPNDGLNKNTNLSSTSAYDASAKNINLPQDEDDLVDRSFQVIPVAATLLPTPINSLGHTNDMRWVILGSEDAYIRKYDFYASMNGKIPLTQAHRHATVDVCSRSGVLLSYWDNQIYHADPALRPPPSSVEEFDKQFSPVNSLYLHSRALWCLSGLNNGDVNLYTVRHEEGTCHHALKGHKSTVSVIKTLSKETKSVTGAWDKMIKIWDLNTGSCIQDLASHSNQICSINVQPDTSEGMLLSSSVDGRSYIWDLRSGSIDGMQPAIEVPLPPDCPRWTTSSCWDRSGKIVYTGRRNGTIDCVDIRMNRLMRTLKLPQNSGPVSQVLAHPNHNFLLCGSFDNLRMWNLDLQGDDSSAAPSTSLVDQTGFISPYQLIPGHQTGTISQMAIDDSGKYLITTSGSRGWEGTPTNTALFYEIKIM
ncbi:Transcription factor spt8 [Entomophthora muscae]|uniref:Transcription factor spt8 n=1 Tax=Entomophthora muscae TaxID=34485 RepID=A0ACC2RH49_9FUNG|nr:Transcription factor spt8 [Entomophthora muscae]